MEDLYRKYTELRHLLDGYHILRRISTGDEEFCFQAEYQMKRLLNNGVRVDIEDKGWTFLHTACVIGDVELLKFLIDLLPNERLRYIVVGLSWDNMSLLHVVCRFTRKFTKEVCEVLLRHGADVNARDGYNGATPLHWACLGYYEFTNKLCEFLLLNGADVNGKDRNKNRPLHWALGRPNADIDEYIRTVKPEGWFDPYLIEDWADPYLIEVAELKSISENLLKHGTDINAMNNEGETPIAYFIKHLIYGWINIKDDSTHAQEEVGVHDVAAQAAERQQDLISAADICDWLINSGADVNTRSSGSRTLFHFMVEHYLQRLKNNARVCEAKLVKELLRVLTKNQNVTVSLNSRNDEGNTPLHIACKPVTRTFKRTLEKKEKCNAKTESLVEYFISCGSKVNAINDLQQTPLHLSSSAPVIKYLLKSGADLRVRDENGNTPLMMWATSCDVTELDSLSSSPTDLKEIIDPGIDPFYANKKGDTVLDITLSRQIFRFLKNFLEAVLSADPGNVNRCDTLGNTFLHVVAECDDDRVQEVIEMLLQKGADPNCVNEKGVTPMHILCGNVVKKYKDEGKQMKRRVGVQTIDTIDFNKQKQIETVPDSIPMNKDKQETEDGGEVQAVLISDSKDEVKELSKEKELMESVSAWAISLLKKYGGDPLKPNGSDKTCIDILCDGNLKNLKKLLETPVEQMEVAPLLPWEQKSLKHRSMLGQVARQRKSEKIETFHYHQLTIASGAFGNVHVGINGEDGREVAVKRVQLARLDRPEDKREIKHLLQLKDCEQIVKYHSYCKDKDFLYIFLELMEGNLDELVCQEKEHVELCRDVMTGLDFLHKNDVLHRDIKPGNILYKTEPRLCLKLADFGLSSKASFNASAATRTVLHSKAGTRCWMAEELHSGEHSKASDVFAAGLVLHYIIAEKKHAFGPKDETGMNDAKIQHEIEGNIMNGQLNLSDTITPEASHLLKLMLQHNKNERPAAANCLTQPFFWSKAKKKEFLCAVGNQPEFAEPRPFAKDRGLTSVELDLETELEAEFSSNPWDTQIPLIYVEMTTMPRPRRYCTTSAVDLVRFVRNSYSHVSGATRPTSFKLELLDRFVYLDKFPTLLITVYDIVMKYVWNGREEIDHVLQKYS